MQTFWAAADNDTTASLIIPLDENEAFNKITVFERCDVKHSPDGFSNMRVNRIRKYSIDIWRDNEWVSVYYSDQPTGDCKVVSLPAPFRTSKLRLRVLKATAAPAIYEMNAIYKR